MEKNNYKIAVIPGDGIGNEVMPEAIRVLEKIAERYNISFDFDHKDWSCERFHKFGSMMPEDGLDEIQDHDSILLGAVGFPGVPDHVSLWGLLIPIRRQFQAGHTTVRRILFQVKAALDAKDSAKVRELKFF